MKRKSFFFLLFVFLMGLPLLQAAGTKEEVVRLQNDVLALQKQIQALDKTCNEQINERIDGLKSLIVQLNDQTAKSNLMLENIKSILTNQNSGMRSTDQAMLQEIKVLAGKLDDAVTSISAMAQQLNELKVQSKPLDQESSPRGSLSPESMYNQAFTDFVQGNFDLSTQGFTAYINAYPGGDKAASALLNIGEAYSNQNKLPQAIAAYTRIINEYSQAPTVPTALFKRAMVELALQKKDDAIADFKNIMDKYPNTPEAEKAKTELQQLGAWKPAGVIRRKSR
jgi:tol-pal system protein YbgF